MENFQPANVVWILRDIFNNLQTRVSTEQIKGGVLFFLGQLIVCSNKSAT